MPTDPDMTISTGAGFWAIPAFAEIGCGGLAAWFRCPFYAGWLSWQQRVSIGSSDIEADVGSVQGRVQALLATAGASTARHGPLRSETQLEGQLGLAVRR